VGLTAVQEHAAHFVSQRSLLRLMRYSACKSSNSRGLVCHTCYTLLQQPYICEHAANTGTSTSVPLHCANTGMQQQKGKSVDDKSECNASEMSWSVQFVSTWGRLQHEGYLYVYEAHLCCTRSHGNTFRLDAEISCRARTFLHRDCSS
jgi:hypothetical protein